MYSVPPPCPTSFPTTPSHFSTLPSSLLGPERGCSQVHCTITMRNKQTHWPCSKERCHLISYRPVTKHLCQQLEPHDWPAPSHSPTCLRLGIRLASASRSWSPGWSLTTVLCTISRITIYCARLSCKRIGIVKRECHTRPFNHNKTDAVRPRELTCYAAVAKVARAPSQGYPQPFVVTHRVHNATLDLWLRTIRQRICKVLLALGLTQTME